MANCFYWSPQLYNSSSNNNKDNLQQKVEKTNVIHQQRPNIERFGSVMLGQVIKLSLVLVAVVIVVVFEVVQDKEWSCGMRKAQRKSFSGYLQNTNRQSFFFCYLVHLTFTTTDHLLQVNINYTNNNMANFYTNLLINTILII